MYQTRYLTASGSEELLKMQLLDLRQSSGSSPEAIRQVIDTFTRIYDDELFYWFSAELDSRLAHVHDSLADEWAYAFSRSDENYWRNFLFEQMSFTCDRAEDEIIWQILKNNPGWFMGKTVNIPVRLVQVSADEVPQNDWKKGLEGDAFVGQVECFSEPVRTGHYLEDGEFLFYSSDSDTIRHVIMADKLNHAYIKCKINP